MKSFWAAVCVIGALSVLPPAGAARKKNAHPSRKAAAREASDAAAAPGHLTVRDQVAQMVMVPFSGQPLKPRSKAWRDLASLVRTQHVGGLILVNVMQGHVVEKADPVQAAKVINSLQRLAKVPLLVGADLERGASMRFQNTTVFPHAMAFTAAGDPAAAHYEGQVTAREARAIGVNWLFYPDADVNSNPDNPIINIRSFSEDPKQVSTYVDAFLDGAASDPHNSVLTTVKHFPGHGDTATDTHLNLATVSGDRKHLDEIELVPFRSAIAHGVDSVMTAHLAVPALGTGEVPATLSAAVLTTLLRQELGFKGLIVTDAMEMGGIAKGYSVADASVRAVEAGADVLLMPSDPVAAINAVVAAVNSGRISRQRIESSVTRILAAKKKLAVNTARYVNTAMIPRTVNQPEPIQRALDVSQKAITLVKNENHLFPIADASHACFAILPEYSNSVEGQALQPELAKRATGRPILKLDPRMTMPEMERALNQAGTCEAWYVAAFVSVAGYRGNISLPGAYPDLLNKLLNTRKPVGLVALGNPYLLRTFPKAAGYMATFSTVPPSELALARALFGEAPVKGRLPVSIPNLAKFGEGIDLSGGIKVAATK